MIPASTRQSSIVDNAPSKSRRRLSEILTVIDIEHGVGPLLDPSKFDERLLS